MASAGVAATTTPTLQENEKPEANQVEEAVIDQGEAPAAEEAPKTGEVVSEEAKVDKAAPIGEEVVALEAEEAAEEEEASTEVVIEE